MTLNQAAGRYWAEKGIDRGDAADVERRIAQLLTLVGPSTRLGDIDQRAVAEAIERRRGIARPRSPRKGAKAYLPSNSTVNRDVIETLRPILKRARTHWTARGAHHGLPDVDWRDLRMTEPRGLSRVYTEAERIAWRDACPDDAIRLALDLLLTNGLRFGELFFPLDAVDLDPLAPTLKLAKGRKRDVILHIPLRRDHARQVAALHSRAAEAGLRHLWFHRVGKKLDSLTYAQLEYRISKAAEAAGLKGGRLIHGARHHAASAVVARTGNIKAVQALLGHASIASSQRYAHMDIKALRAAVEDPEPAAATPAAKPGKTA